MKFNQFYSSPIPLYKYVLVSLLCIIYFPLSANTINVDSLKTILKSSDSDINDCSIVYKIYSYYETIGQIDSMNFYARNLVRVCDFSNDDHYSLMSNMAINQYKGGFANNINQTMDSILLLTEDPDLKLQYLIFLSEDNYFYTNSDEYLKYLNHAHEIINYTTTKFSKFLYYTFLGARERYEGNTFASFQNYKLAAEFAEREEDILLNKSDLANLYLINGEIDKSKDIFIELLENTKKGEPEVFTMWFYFPLIDCYYQSEDYNEAIKLSQESINYTYSLKTKSDVPLGFVYSMIGKSYLALDNMDSTKYYLEKGIEHSLKHNNVKELADNYFVLSDYYRAIGNREKARLYLEKAQKEISYNNDNPSADKGFAELWAEDKMYSKAYFHLKKYTDYRLQKEKDGKKDLALATKIIEDSYKYKEESQANLLMAKQKEERLRNLIALTLAGLFLIALLLMYVQKNRKKLELLNNEISKQNKELDILINKQKETIKYLDNFASVAAHDLKAPITTAIGFAETLADKAEDKLNERHKTYLNYIISNVFKLSIMIDNLLCLSRLDVNLPEAKQVDLNDTIAQVKLSLTNLLNEKGASIIVESSLPKIVGHATLMSQLFQNIIKNAIVHNKTGKDTIVKISSESSNDDMYTIKISDNSGGVPDFIVPTMFDLFSSSDKNSGNGIGLASCKKIVNHYGGEIWVDVNAGVGSTFNFHLPISN